MKLSSRRGSGEHGVRCGHLTPDLGSGFTDASHPVRRDLGGREGSMRTGDGWAPSGGGTYSGSVTVASITVV